MRRQRLTKLIIVALAVFLVFAPVSGSAGYGNVCPNGNVFTRLFTDVCWSCIFPVIIGGLTIGDIDKAPDGRAEPSPPFLCFCTTPRPPGFEFGVPLGFWEPSKLVELTRLPFCSPTLGGLRLQINKSRLLSGDTGVHADETNDKMFYNYHYFSFPLLIILELFTEMRCNADGYVDLDLLYLSELDPTWSDDELDIYNAPETVLFANPFAQMACLGDAAMGLAGKTLDSLFWCAGNWGSMYPFSGSITHSASRPLVSSLQSARVLSAMHRRGLAWKTMGDDALCKGYIFPMIPKNQYRLENYFPVAESDGNHAIGETPFRWGEWRNMPGFEDYIYWVWRWDDCCLR
ncbi:MAG: TraU family protein [Desulfobaccales bacterium]